MLSSYNTTQQDDQHTSIGTIHLVTYSVPLFDTYMRFFLHMEQAMLWDTRMNPVSHNPIWSKDHLNMTYPHYYWMGEKLGNKNYNNERGIELADPDHGIPYLISFLQEGWHIALLCGCRGDHCHNRKIVRIIKGSLPDVKIRIMPGMVK